MIDGLLILNVFLSKYNNFKMVFLDFAFVNLRFLIYIDSDFAVSIPAFFNMPISMKKVPV